MWNCLEMHDALADYFRCEDLPLHAKLSPGHGQLVLLLDVCKSQYTCQYMIYNFKIHNLPNNNNHRVLMIYINLT